MKTIELGTVRHPSQDERGELLLGLIAAYKRRGPIPRTWRSPQGELRQLAEQAAAFEWVRELLGPEIVASVRPSPSGCGIAIVLEPCEQAPALTYRRRGMGQRPM